MHGILKLEILKRFYHFYFLNKDYSVTIQDINLRFYHVFLTSLSREGCLRFFI